MPLLLIAALLGLLYAGSHRHKDYGPVIESFKVGDIQVDRFNGGFARTTSPRGSAIAAGKPPHIVEMLSGNRAGVEADLRSLG